MTNRIIQLDANGQPPPKPPLNVPNVIKKAGEDWRNGKKNEAFQLALGALSMVCDGLARLAKDVEQLRKQVTPK